MLPVLLGPNHKFYWNVEAHVGPGCRNNVEDVQLVQLAYACGVLNAAVSYAESRIYRTVTPGAPYTGATNDPLTIAIKIHQKSRGGTQDGKVSPMGQSGNYGQHSWMLIPLNDWIRNEITNGQWPRIDHHPKCTAVLRNAVHRSLHVDLLPNPR